MWEPSDLPKGIDIEKASELARSEAGQALFATLQAQHADTLQDAMTQVQAGNYIQAKNAIVSLLRSPEGRALLRRIKEGQDG